MEMIDVVRKLVGEIQPVGESHIDSKRYNNLNEMIELVDYLIADIHSVSNNRKRQEASMKKAGKVAHEFLCELGVSEDDQ